jgi:hypothetical protein
MGGLILIKNEPFSNAFSIQASIKNRGRGKKAGKK